eukprot:TRINITY_DN13486_c0_g1_i1.p1 TRINITY_DN13486_c0_g1~~TRINITY_DN13486_c0_g1_i1.p1  ORF type:complete len:237 (-),score=80.51 TRINITY_DN13486_c0_g1_i1:16-675(-)
MAEVKLTPHEQRLNEIQEKLGQIDVEQMKAVRQLEKEVHQKATPIYKQRREIVKKIPNFWKDAISKHAGIMSTLSEEDVEILDYLEDVWVTELFDAEDGFEVSLTFKKGNPYFGNNKISRKIVSNDEEPATITATKIDWRKNKSLVVDLEEEKNEGIQLHWFGLWESDVEDSVCAWIRDEVWKNPGQEFQLNLEDLQYLMNGEGGEDDQEEGEEDQEEQ